MPPYNTVDFDALKCKSIFCRPVIFLHKCASSEISHLDICHIHLDIYTLSNTIMLASYINCISKCLPYFAKIYSIKFSQYYMFRHSCMSSI